MLKGYDQTVERKNSVIIQNHEKSYGFIPANLFAIASGEERR